MRVNEEQASSSYGPAVQCKRPEWSAAVQHPTHVKSVLHPVEHGAITMVQIQVYSTCLSSKSVCFEFEGSQPWNAWWERNKPSPQKNGCFAIQKTITFRKRGNFSFKSTNQTFYPGKGCFPVTKVWRWVGNEGSKLEFQNFGKEGFTFVQETLVFSCWNLCSLQGISTNFFGQTQTKYSTNMH